MNEEGSFHLCQVFLSLIEKYDTLEQDCLETAILTCLCEISARLYEVSLELLFQGFT